MRIVLVDPSRAVQRAMTQLIKEGGHDVVVYPTVLKRWLTSPGTPTSAL